MPVPFLINICKFRDGQARPLRFPIYNPETGSEFSDKLEIHTIELPKIPATDDGTQLWW